MNFKESYKKEMNHIKHNTAIDDKILDSMEQPVHRRRHFAGWGVAVAAMACVVMISMNSDVIAGYTETIVGRFHLIFGDEEEIKLSEMIPIEVDLEKHYAYVENNGGQPLYETQEMLEANTGIMLTESKHLELKDIVADITEYYKTGHLSMEVFCDAGQYHMNGMFILEGYDHNHLDYGYGETIKPYYTYEYAEGRYAYFVKDGKDDVVQRIYFSERGIMYQLFVENSEEGKEHGKRIVKYMAE